VIGKLEATGGLSPRLGLLEGFWIIWQTLEKGGGQAVAEIAKVPAADMKNSPLTMFLLGALAISALLSAVFCAFYIVNIQEFRALQSQVTRINNRGAAIMSLANESLEYSKRDSSIDPILEWSQFKQVKSAAATNKPAAK